jgi:hypothetical protein
MQLEFWTPIRTAGMHMAQGPSFEPKGGKKKKGSK